MKLAERAHHGRALVRVLNAEPQRAADGTRAEHVDAEACTFGRPPVRAILLVASCPHLARGAQLEPRAQRHAAAIADPARRRDRRDANTECEPAVTGPRLVPRFDDRAERADPARAGDGCAGLA